MEDKVWVYLVTSTRIWSFFTRERTRKLKSGQNFKNLEFIKTWYKIHLELELPAAWPNGYGVRLRIGRLWVRVPSWSNVLVNFWPFDPWPWTYLKCYSEFLIQNIFYRHMPCQTVWRFITYFWTATVKIHKKIIKIITYNIIFSIFRVFSFHIISVYGQSVFRMSLQPQIRR